MRALVWHDVLLDCIYNPLLLPNNKLLVSQVKDWKVVNICSLGWSHLDLLTNIRRPAKRTFSYFESYKVVLLKYDAILMANFFFSDTEKGRFFLRKVPYGWENYLFHPWWINLNDLSWESFTLLLNYAARKIYYQKKPFKLFYFILPSTRALDSESVTKVIYNLNY